MSYRLKAEWSLSIKTSWQANTIKKQIFYVWFAMSLKESYDCFTFALSLVFIWSCKTLSVLKTKAVYPKAYG